MGFPTISLQGATQMLLWIGWARDGYLKKGLCHEPQAQPDAERSLSLDQIPPLSPIPGAPAARPQHRQRRALPPELRQRFHEQERRRGRGGACAQGRYRD